MKKRHYLIAVIDGVLHSILFYAVGFISIILFRAVTSISITFLFSCLIALVFSCLFFRHYIKMKKHQSIICEAISIILFFCSTTLIIILLISLPTSNAFALPFMSDADGLLLIVTGGGFIAVFLLLRILSILFFTIQIFRERIQKMH